MNPTQLDWPLTGDHPDWCGGFFCERTDLGYTHRSEPLTLHLDDGHWELTIQRADEPGEGETQIYAVSSGLEVDEPWVTHVFTKADKHKLCDALNLMGEQAWAEESAPMLEVVR